MQISITEAEAWILHLFLVCTQIGVIIVAVPGFECVDHIGLTVPDIASAVKFYETAFGATVLDRLGPIGADEMPKTSDGMDWMEAHIDVPGARLEKILMQLGPSMRIELFQYLEPVSSVKSPPKNSDIGGHHIAFKVEKIEPATDYLVALGCRKMPSIIDVTDGERSQYMSDPWGNYFELMEY